MKFKTILLALLLSGCSSGQSSPPPVQHPAQVSMNPAAWSLLYGLGANISAAPGGGFQFSFPATSAACPDPTEATTTNCPSVHYVETASPLLKAGQTITMSGSIQASSDAVFNYTIDADNPTTPGGHPAACRIFFEQAGDQALNQPYYRWWASDPADVVLGNGVFSISSSLAPTQGWSSVFGETANHSAAATAGFNQAMANVASIGFTCGGGSFYGHGVNMSAGTATMIVNSFTVTP